MNDLPVPAASDGADLEAQRRAIPEKVDLFLRRVVDWASTQDHVLAVILVGSYARAEARDDSDVDVVLLAQEPRSFVDDHRWCAAMGPVQRVQVERWGAVDSVRVGYASGVEAEYGIAGPEWIQTPLDEGTARVLRNGYLVLLDPLRLLSAIALGPPERATGSGKEPPMGYQPNPSSDFRVKFDFRVDFTNGGYVEGHDFLLDLERPEVSDTELAHMIVDAMNLARAGRVRIENKRVVRRGENDDAAPESLQS